VAADSLASPSRRGPSAERDVPEVRMDPITLIVTALAAGASAGMTDSVSQAVKDTYKGLKELVLRRVREQPAGEIAVLEHAQDPDTWRGPLTKALASGHADRDLDLVRVATQLLGLIDPEGTSAGTYNLSITATGDRSVAAHTIHGAVHTGDTTTTPSRLED
jgi:hypothetical protein